jgi:hypothetical protein
MQQTIYIDDTIQGASYIDWYLLTDFQGNLKERSEIDTNDLLTMLFELGFFDIKKVWQKGNITYIADGHGTIATLNSVKDKLQSGEILMLNKSNGLPTTKIPCVFINAENENDLAKKILAINKNYGTITREGLSDFKAAFKIDDFYMQQVSMPQWELPEIQPVFISEGIPPIALNNAQIGDTISVIDKESKKDTSEKEVKQVSETSEFAALLNNADYDYIMSILNRVKKDCVIDKTSEALIHIVKQYETYCLDL